MTESALQTAIYSKLVADTDIDALAQGIYSDPPQASDSGSITPFPYVAIGDDAVNTWDTKSVFGQNALCTVNVYSRAQSKLEVKTLGALVRACLHHQPLSITGATHTMTVVESATYSKEPDGATQRGVLLVRVYYQEDA